MLQYIARRLLALIPLLIGMSLVSFFIMNLAPGDYLGEMKLNPAISPELIEQMRAQFGLDKPVYVQYFRWLGNALRLNFGQSFQYNVPVFYLIKTRLWNSFILSLFSTIVSWALAIPIGIHAATHQYKLSDKFLTVFAFAGMSSPTFFTALLMLFIVVKGNNAGIWSLPVGGMTSPDYSYLPVGAKILDVAKHMLVPVAVLGLLGVASLMRQMRAQVLDVMRMDYVTTARSKGLTERKVINKHVVRNAINPLITMFGFTLANLFSGAAILENVVAWPGLGTLTLQAVQTKDLYLTMGSMVFGGVLLIFGNLTADVLLALSDPRIRYS